MSKGLPLRAVLFDIDGTLVDSNYLHVDAWARAFAEVGEPVDTWRIHRSIGMDSAALLDSLLGDAAARVGDDAKERHSRYYEEASARLRPLSGARELLAAVKQRGLQVVLATSAPEDELKILLQVLYVDGLLDVVTSSADVETAKPEPDLIQVALQKAGVSADEAVMVGDAVYDVLAATAAGVTTLGLRSGGVADAELVGAGAARVYDDPAALLAALDQALRLGEISRP